MEKETLLFEIKPVYFDKKLKITCGYGIHYRFCKTDTISVKASDWRIKKLKQRLAKKVMKEKVKHEKAIQRKWESENL